jgi:hypothetical protein
LQNQTGDPCLGLDGRAGHRGPRPLPSIAGMVLLCKTRPATLALASMAGPAIEGTQGGQRSRGRRSRVNLRSLFNSFSIKQTWRSKNLASLVLLLWENKLIRKDKKIKKILKIKITNKIKI